MGIQKSHKNEMLVEALENRFDKVLCLAMGQHMMENNNLDSYMNVEEMKAFKAIYDEYKLLVAEAKVWAREQDDADHMTNCNIYQMQKSLERIERKLDHKN